MAAQKFPGEIDLKGKLMGYFGILLFVIIGLFGLIFKINFWWIILGFGVFCFILLVSTDIPRVNYYMVEDNEIRCRRGWARKSIPFGEIADIRKIKWEDLKEMTSESWIRMAQVRYQTRHTDRRHALSHPEEIPQTARAAWKYGKLLGYCTAAPSTKVYKGKANIMVKRIDYILLTLKNGEQHVLSPKNPDGFLKMVRAGQSNFNPLPQ